MTIVFKNPSVEYRGVEYQVETAIIESTWIGVEDHGLFSINVNFVYDGGSHQGTGHYAVGENGEHLGPFVKGILDVVGGYANWEELKGHRIYVLRDKGYNGRVRGIFSTDHQRVFMFEDIFPKS